MEEVVRQQLAFALGKEMYWIQVLDVDETHAVLTVGHMGKPLWKERLPIIKASVIFAKVAESRNVLGSGTEAEKMYAKHTLAMIKDGLLDAVMAMEAL